MSEYDIQTRLFGKEDIDFDTEGTGAQTEYTDLDGNTHPVTKLNASHIPITHSARIATEGATNVDDAVKELSKEIRDLAGQNGIGQSEDRTIVLAEQDSRQGQINEPFRNLGGHTLTFKFPEEGDVNVALAPLEFQGFYNGVLVIDLNGCDIHDNGTFSPEGVLRIKNCHCHVRIIGDGRSSSGYGKIIFTDNHYGIAVIESPSCSVEHMAFESSSTADDFALYTESGNAYFTSCTFTGCGRALIKSIYKDYVDAHMVDAQAHASLFAAKANLIHTHTQANVSGLVSDLAGKAPLNHSHSLDDITNFSSGSLNSAHWADSAGYNGPFAVKSVGLNPYSGIDIIASGGTVYFGGSAYSVNPLSSGSIFLSSGAVAYLHFYSSGGGYEYEYVNNAVSSGASGHYYTRIGGNEGGNTVQYQYGDITYADGGGSSSGIPLTKINFSSAVTIEFGYNGSGLRYTTGDTVSSGGYTYTHVGSGLGGVLIGTVNAPDDADDTWDLNLSIGDLGDSGFGYICLLRPGQQFVSSGTSTYGAVYAPRTGYVYIPIDPETKFFVYVNDIHSAGLVTSSLKFYPRVPLNS